MKQTIKEKRDEKFIKKHQGKHFCKCGCGEEIIIKSYQRIYGTPNFILGHHTKELHNRSEVKESKSKKMRGENNPMYGKKRPDISGNKNPLKRADLKELQSKRMIGQDNSMKKSEVKKKIREFWAEPKERKRMSNQMKEFYEKHPEVKKARSKQMKELRKTLVFPVKDTSIEIKIQNFLKQLGIEYFTHQYMKIKHGYQCDILIPVMNLVIECDGDYWHKYPVGKDIDHIRTKELIKKGFKVLRLWEFEINAMTINEFERKIK